jgi:hypothetical protein
MTLALLRAWTRELDLALEVLADVAAQRVDRAAADAERLRDRFVDRRQVLRLDLLHRSR